MVFSFLFSCYVIIVISFRLFWWAQLIKWFLKEEKITLLRWLTDFIERLLFAFWESSGMHVAFLSNRNDRFSTGFQLSMCFSFSSVYLSVGLFAAFHFTSTNTLFISLFFRPCDSDGWDPSGEDNNNINNNPSKKKKKKWKKWSSSKSTKNKTN